MAFGIMTDGITKGQVLRYMFMPQLVPRLNALATGGFSNLAYLMALVYRAVNILPADHAVFRPENRRSLGLRQIMGIAASNLVFDKKHIDQIIIYFSIMVGLVLLTLQFFLMLGYIMMNPALAQELPQTYGEFFANPHKEDIAYMLLYAIFGVPELFKAGGAPTQFHMALYSLFQLYSIGLLVVAVIIICYFIFAIVAETAQTGVPFGKRYNHVWTPIRLVFALGLLIPIAYGLNSGQWITLYAAKLGSDYATKGWVLFNETMNEEYLSDVEERVGTPKPPNFNQLAAFMTVAVTCKQAYTQVNRKVGPNIQAYAITEGNAEIIGQPPLLSDVESYKPTGKTKKRPKDILVRFGVYDKGKYPDEKGHVFPYCGDLAIFRTESSEQGSAYIQNYYIQLVQDLWNGEYGLAEEAEALVSKHIKMKTAYRKQDPDFKAQLMKAIIKNVMEKIDQAVKNQARSENWQQEMADVEKRGWGGAGIWYNKIAQINGSLVGGINNIPAPRAMPALMVYTRNKNLAQEQTPVDLGAGQAGGVPVIFGNATDEVIAGILNAANREWVEDGSFGDYSGQTKFTGNFFIDAVNLVFGMQGLFAMCQNTDVHPLAQLSVLGKGLVEASVRNIALGVGFGAVSMLPIDILGPAAGAASAILFSVATITIVMGFILYHVIPFMPFLYFFFAVTGWVKGLFEAMVGVPLWALAFLRIDGEGLPGSAAMDGFYLILEIFLRPIMIIFGLLASVVIFAAMVKVLNEIFFLVVHNVTGHDPGATAMCGSPGGGETTAAEKTAEEFFRGPIDELFFTILYAIIVYMIAMSCFKLIDLVPNNILRYMGANINSFNDKAADPAEGLMMRLSVGGSTISGRVFGGAEEGGIVANLTGAVSNTAKGFTSMRGQ